MIAIENKSAVQFAELFSDVTLVARIIQYKRSRARGCVMIQGRVKDNGDCDRVERGPRLAATEVSG